MSASKEEGTVVAINTDDDWSWGTIISKNFGKVCRMYYVLDDK